MLFINKENYHWTDHVKQKMRQYGLSESRIKRVLRFPKRVEVGVAEDTVAGMQPAGSPKHPFEIWVMWAQNRKERIANGKSQEKAKKRFSLGSQKITIISAWRYPGVSPLREPPPIPDDVWDEVRRMAKS